MRDDWTLRGYQPRMTESQRNLLILLAVAVVGVVFSGAFNLGTGVVSLLLNVAFMVVIVWAIVAFYQRNSGTIALMPTGPRLLLQVAGIALLAIFVTGTLSFLPAPFGWSNRQPLLFWGGIFACGFAVWYSWQQRTSKW